MKATERILGAALIALSLNACNVQESFNTEVHGHRGATGSMPGNTLPSFLKAIDLGCDYIEMDVVLTKDMEVLVSHEPWMDPASCLLPDGRPIPLQQARQHNIFRMTLKEAQRYDCGSIADPRFPQQQQLVAFKPTLREVVEEADEYAFMSGNLNPSFNIEIKSDPQWYGEFQPEPAEYAQAVMSLIISIGLADRCIIQSFDPAILNEVNRIDPSIKCALLVENDLGLEGNLARLGFTPAIYSPNFTLVDRELVKALRDRELQLLVWTVNEKKDIQRMLELGVDGIISDHPERVVELIEARE